MARIAFLGTGLLGSGMVRHFLNAGTPVTVWNRTETKARALEVDGAKVAASPADAVAGADHIHLVLPDDGVVDGILEQIAPALKRGALVIDHSTTLPEATKPRFERLRVRGIRFLHAPVFMSPQMAADGVGLMLVSGPKAEFEDVRGLADIMAMARANGIPPLDALEVFSKFQAGNIIQGRGPRMARGDVAPSFTLQMARKDVGLMMAAAKGEPLVALPCIAKRMDEVIASGGGELDVAAIGGTAAGSKGRA